MLRRIDTFTWVVILFVLLLLAIAIVTVNWTGGAGWTEEDYITEDTPEAPVHNAFLALQQGDLFRARANYSDSVLEEISSNQGYDPFRDRSTNQNARRLRIIEVELDEENPNRALVTFALDSFTNNGFFGSGSTWSRTSVVEVVREEETWKIDTQEFFY